MELVLGLPAMNRFDRTATPMTACFSDRANDTPFTHLPNQIPLDELNPPLAALRGERKRWAQACARLDWSDVDRANPATVAHAWCGRCSGRANRFLGNEYHNLNVKDDD